MTERPKPIHEPLQKPANYATASGAQASASKSVALRNPRLLAMARGKPCLLLIPGVCCGDAATTVACHSNQSIHGKGGARKADDAYTVWGCFTCHSWLDQGGASKAEKTAAFDAALNRQLAGWQSIINDQASHPADIAAAEWAINNQREK